MSTARDTREREWALIGCLLQVGNGMREVRMDFAEWLHANRERLRAENKGRNTDPELELDLFDQFLASRPQVLSQPAGGPSSASPPKRPMRRPAGSRLNLLRRRKS